MTTQTAPYPRPPLSHPCFGQCEDCQKNAQLTLNDSAWVCAECVLPECEFCSTVAQVRDGVCGDCSTQFDEYATARL